MTRLRKAIAYRRIERAYTRYSKYKQQCYVRARPVCKVVSFDLGEPKNVFEFLLTLVAKSDLQIRMYPHHILRENPLASGAGADRMSTGMAHNYGKPIGVAAQIHAGKALFTLRLNKENLAVGRHALKRASYKLPCACAITTVKNPLFKVSAAKPAASVSA